MVPKPKHDIYIKTSENQYAKIAWFHEFKPFELMIGFYGLNGKDPILAYEYPDRIVTMQEMLNLKIPHKAAISIGNIPIDHFTFHKDEKNKPGRFHLRYGKDPKHVVQFKGNIDINSPIILDFFIISDIASQYNNSITKPDSTDIVFNVNPKSILALRGQYSGINFDLETELKKQAQILGLSYIDSIAYADNKLKGYITHNIIDAAQLDKQALQNMNGGTYFVISFPIDKDKFLLKTFILK